MRDVAYKHGLWLLLVCLTLCAAACAPVAAPAPQVIERVVPVTVTPMPVAVPKVALIMNGKRDDQSWNQYMADDLQKLADQGKAQVSYAEDVSPADYERVAGDYATQKYDLIIAHTEDYIEPALKVAAEYPDSHFALTGGSRFLPNLAGLNTWDHQSSAVAGYLAALLSKTGTVGVVGAFSYPTQLVEHEGFKFGVFSANQEALQADKDAKQVHCVETFTNTWSDAALGFEAAQAQMDQGADIMYITASGPGFGVIQAAQESKKALVIGAFVDMNSFAPEVVVTSSERHAELPLEAVLADIQAGTFTGKDYSFDLTNGGVALSPYHSFDSQIPEDVKSRVEQFKDKVISGQVRVPFVTAKLGGETVCEVKPQ